MRTLHLILPMYKGKNPAVLIDDSSNEGDDSSDDKNHQYRITEVILPSIF